MQRSTSSRSAHGAAVLGLLCSRSPAHIAGFVMAVVVFAVEGVPAARPTTHVGQEGLVALAPAGTDANWRPSAAVVAPELRFWVVAPRQHAAPGSVFDGSSRFTVCDVASSATTRSNRARAQRVDILDALLAAGATTRNPDLPITGVTNRAACNDESAKLRALPRHSITRLQTALNLSAQAAAGSAQAARQVLDLHAAARSASTPTIYRPPVAPDPRPSEDCPTSKPSADLGQVHLHARKGNSKSVFLRNST